MDMSCGCRVGPGKFEGEPALTFLAFQHVGNEDASTGRTDWFRKPFNFDTGGAVEAALAYGYCQPCINAALADDSYGLGITTDEQGFVWLDCWATQAEFDKALDNASMLEQDANDGGC
jgi:hypothetical protein